MAVEQNKLLEQIPQELINALGEYGCARVDGVSEVERLHRWKVVLEEIKSYALAQMCIAVEALPELQHKAQDYDRLAWLAARRRHALERIVGEKPLTATPLQHAQHIQRIAAKALQSEDTTHGR